TSARSRPARGVRKETSLLRGSRVFTGLSSYRRRGELFYTPPYESIRDWISHLRNLRVFQRSPTTPPCNRRWIRTAQRVAPHTARASHPDRRHGAQCLSCAGPQERCCAAFRFQPARTRGCRRALRGSRTTHWVEIGVAGPRLAPERKAAV